MNRTVDIYKYKAFIFDMDGVIVHNHIYHLKAWNLFCDKHNFDFDITTFSEKFFGKSNFEILSTLSGGNISERDAIALGEQKEAIYRDLYINEIKPHVGLVEFLKKLRSKQKLTAIASSAPISNINFVLDTLNIRRYFNAIVDASMVKQSKPNPEIYLKASEALGALPTECMVFEDSHSGIESALNAGMQVVVLSTTHKIEELNYNLLIVNDFLHLQI